MKRKPTMVHAKPTAKNSTETAQARLSGLGACGGKGSVTGADLEAREACCDWGAGGRRRSSGDPARENGRRSETGDLGSIFPHSAKSPCPQFETAVHWPHVGLNAIRWH
jgi:hypothetical protein